MSLSRKEPMTLFLTECPLSLFAQTMVYTIHEIPIFIAMGVVGKGHPSQDTDPPGPMNPHHTKDSSWCLPVGTECVGGQGLQDSGPGPASK